MSVAAAAAEGAAPMAEHTLERVFGELPARVDVDANHSYAADATTQELLDLEPGPQEQFLSQSPAHYTDDLGRGRLAKAIASLWVPCRRTCSCYRDLRHLRRAGVPRLQSRGSEPGVPAAPKRCVVEGRGSGALAPRRRLAKTYGLPGLRVGWLVCRDKARPFNGRPLKLARRFGQRTFPHSPGRSVAGRGEAHLQNEKKRKKSGPVAVGHGRGGRGPEYA